jgi:hypothetical protein
MFISNRQANAFARINGCACRVAGAWRPKQLATDREEKRIVIGERVKIYQMCWTERLNRPSKSPAPGIGDLNGVRRFAADIGACSIIQTARDSSRPALPAGITHESRFVMRGCCLWNDAWHRRGCFLATLRDGEQF